MLARSACCSPPVRLAAAVAAAAAAVRLRICLHFSSPRTAAESTVDCPLVSSLLSATSGKYPRIRMHPPLTIHRHPMCAEIIEAFQKCHTDHPVKKFFGECTDLKVKLDRCFREEKAIKRKVNFEESKKFKEKLQAYRKELSEQEKESAAL